jgi:hypothetical protein
MPACAYFTSLFLQALKNAETVRPDIVLMVAAKRKLLVRLEMCLLLACEKKGCRVGVANRVADEM